MDNRLSACIITCNDEVYICDALKMLEGMEVIIADIGSQDNTVEIARRQGAHVFNIEWNRNFGEVKNFCMEQATGRWVLFIQADETISIEKTISALKNPNVEAFLMTTDYNSESFQVASPVQAIRLVRNRKEYRFSGRSFERIPDDALTGVVDAGIIIRRQRDAMLSWDIAERFEILKDEALQNPDDGYLQYMMGVMLLNQSKLEECIPCFEAATREVNIGHLYAPHLYKCLGFAYLCLNCYEDTERVLGDGAAYFPFYSDLFIIRAELYRQQNRPDEAVRDLLYCRSLRERPNLTVPLPEIGNAYMEEMLGDICLEKYQDIQALNCYFKAYESDQSDLELVIKILDTIDETQAYREAGDFLRLAVDCDGSLETVIGSFMKRRLFGIVLACIEEIAPKLGEARAKSVETICRLMTGQILCKDITEPDDETLFRIVESCWFDGRMQQSAQMIESIHDVRMKELYRAIQGLLSGDRISISEEYEFDAVKMIHDDFLWKGQPQKARQLLSILLPTASGDQLLALALKWAALGDLDAIQSILLNINENKDGFISHAVQKLLRRGYAAQALKLKDMGNGQLPGILEELLWAAEILDKLDRFAKDLKPVKRVPPKESDNGLIEFYRARFDDEACDDIVAGDINVSKIHERIGDAYQRQRKETEALTAYSRAVRLDHYNFSAHEKLLGVTGNDMEKVDSVLPDGWEPREWLHFLEGLEYFYKGNLHLAGDIFMSLSGNLDAHPVICDCSAACLLLDGKQYDIPGIQYDLQNVLKICCDHIRRQLLKYESCSLAKMLLDKALAIKENGCS